LKREEGEHVRDEPYKTCKTYKRDIQELFQSILSS
jgi:hypothetical protein